MRRVCAFLFLALRFTQPLGNLAQPALHSMEQPLGRDIVWRDASGLRPTGPALYSPFALREVAQSLGRSIIWRDASGLRPTGPAPQKKSLPVMHWQGGLRDRLKH